MESKKETNLTPMQKAKRNIKVAYILAFISAGITLFAILVSLTGEELVNGINPLALVDVALVIVLAILLITLKSRTAAIILFSHFLLSKILIFVDNPDIAVASSVMALPFMLGYFYGILGTFSYHKIKKEENEEEEKKESASEE